MTALLWLTRDLRVHDHPALRAALDGGDGVVPVFCFDDRLLGGRHASGPRTQFLLECLADEPSAMEYFRSLPKSHQNYFGNWIRSAKTDSTRTRRIARVVGAMLKHQNYAEMIRAR